MNLWLAIKQVRRILFLVKAAELDCKSPFAAFPKMAVAE